MVRSDSARAAVEALGVPAVPGDLADRDSLSRALAGASDLVMLASLGFGHAPALVEAARAHGIRRALFVGTTAVFTRISASSKAVRLEAEEVIRSSPLAWTLIRPTMIYGAPGDRNMERLLRYVKRIPLFPVPGSGRHLLQPVHVEDLARGIVEAFCSDKTHRRCYDLSGAEPNTFREIVRLAARAVGRRVVFVPVPLGAASALLRIYEKGARRPRLRVEQLLRLNEDKAFSHALAAEDFEFAPRRFSEGITEEARLLFGPSL
jgi:uncharacterized protein YbjT (DUF2867 family)